MLRRCYDTEYRNYPAYGGRGIAVCRRWHFYCNFYDDNITKWTKGLEIDRVDNDKGYNPDNVRFVTHRENMQNTRVAARRKEVANLVLLKLRERRGG